MTGRYPNQYATRKAYPAELAARRQRIAMTQATLARAIYCAPNSINAWECGRTRPHPDLVAAARAAIAAAELKLLAELLEQHPPVHTGTQEGT